MEDSGGTVLAMFDEERGLLWLSVSWIEDLRNSSKDLDVSFVTEEVSERCDFVDSVPFCTDSSVSAKETFVPPTA